MRSLLFAAVLGLALGLVTAIGSVYALSHGKITTRFVAKELCSCLFVMRQSETYCRSFVSVGPTWFVLTRVKNAERRVEASGFLLLHAGASDQGPRSGCALDP